MTILKNRYGFAQAIDPKMVGGRLSIGESIRSLALRREKMAERLTSSLGLNPIHKKAMEQIPRHLFVAESLWSRAYEEMTMPIGFGQTMSRPSVVARLLQLALPGDHFKSDQKAKKVLEIGTGCGYLTALIAAQGYKVISIERILNLFEIAKRNLDQFQFPFSPQLILGDGHLGYFKAAPFDSIIISAACAQIPLMLVDQLAEKGRMVFPLAPFLLEGEGTPYQELTLIEKLPAGKFRTTALDKVQFVPLLEGIKNAF
jgi:protein-L-isoaspartate(D-aspartate) O-methyltransferase